MASFARSMLQQYILEIKEAQTPLSPLFQQKISYAFGLEGMN